VRCTPEDFEANIVFAAAYYDGVGMAMPGKVFVTQDHRYGAQGSEVDQERDGSRDRITTYYREGNLKTMRWDSPDPIIRAGQSPYAMFDNNPVLHNDPDGDCPPGVDCDNPLPIMQIRVNRASNLGQGVLRNNSTKFHAGHDLYAPKGTPVMTVMTGKVIASAYSPSYGNYVTVAHYKPLTAQQKLDAEDPQKAHTVTPEIAYYTFYSHLDSKDVKKGDYVNMGQKIGEVGTTGNAKGLTGDNVHLHFEIGTELRSANSSFLKKESLLDANVGYKDVQFTSQQPDQNDQNVGVYKTTTSNEGKTTTTYKQDYTSPNKAGKTTVVGSSTTEK